MKTKTKQIYQKQAVNVLRKINHDHDQNWLLATFENDKEFMQSKKHIFFKSWLAVLTFLSIVSYKNSL